MQYQWHLRCSIDGSQRRRGPARTTRARPAERSSTRCVRRRPHIRRIVSGATLATAATVDGASYANESSASRSRAPIRRECRHRAIDRSSTIKCTQRPSAIRRRQSHIPNPRHRLRIRRRRNAHGARRFRRRRSNRYRRSGRSRDQLRWQRVRPNAHHRSLRYAHRQSAGATRLADRLRHPRGQRRQPQPRSIAAVAGATAAAIASPIVTAALSIPAALGLDGASSTTVRRPSTMATAIVPLPPASTPTSTGILVPCVRASSKVRAERSRRARSRVSRPLRPGRLRSVRAAFRTQNRKRNRLFCVGRDSVPSDVSIRACGALCANRRSKDRIARAAAADDGARRVKAGCGNRLRDRPRG